VDAQSVVLALGPAGTGKTYLAIAKAVEALESGKVSRIVLSRPAVEAGENLGFLPGDLTEKLAPYLRPLYDALYDLLEPEKVDRFLEKNVIEIAPIAFMRGRTLNDSFVILDEAQNTTSEQMKMFVTRLGFNSKAVITGDITQIDLRQVASDRHAAFFAQPRQEHLHLHWRGVLGFVENDEAVGQRASAHEGKRRDLDLAARHATHHLVGGHHIVEGVIERPQIGIDLFAQVARKKTQPLAGFHRRARQHDAVDLALGQQRDGNSNRQISLAGAGRTDAEGKFVFLERAHILGLHRRTRRDVAALGADRSAIAVEQAGLAAFRGQRQAHRGIDLAQIHAEPALQALI